MIDCSDRKRLIETGNELTELLLDEKLDQVPLLVFANKQDLSNVMKASEIAETIGLVKLKDRTWQIQACSAIEGTGVKVKTQPFVQSTVILTIHLSLFAGGHGLGL